MRRKGARILVAVATVAALGFILVELNERSLPEGPSAIVWDREVCEHCKMHIGDPRFAAQVQAVDGAVINFDDPGCLAEYLAARPTGLHAIYFRDHQGDRWLSESEAAFLPADDSPMGYGIRAVEAGTPESQDWEWARKRALGRRQQQGGL